MATMQRLTPGEFNLARVLAFGDDPMSGRNFDKECTAPSYVAAMKAHAERKKIEDDAFQAEMDDLFKEAEEAPHAIGAKPEEVDAPLHPLIGDGSKAEVATPAEAESPPLPPAEDPMPIKATAASDYSFPICRCVTGSGVDFRKELEALTKVFKATKDYSRVRDQFCAASVALNEQGLWAPRFRPQPKLRPQAPKSLQNNLLHRDQLVIDAHWLWANKLGAKFSAKYESLLDSTQPFDFTLAAEYARENWSSNFRADEHFCLTSRVQWQLFTTKSTMHCDRYRELVDGNRVRTKRTPALVKPIMKAIATWADDSSPIKGQEQAYADLWLAREMLGAGVTNKYIAELAGLMAGNPPLEASTVRKKLSGLDKRMALGK